MGTGKNDRAGNIVRKTLVKFDKNHMKDLSQELFLIKLKRLILVRSVLVESKSNIRPRLVDIVNGKHPWTGLGTSRLIYF